ncbi:MAG: sulfur carrier protein ThiS [Chloroflexi bacterium]|nr:sulfur carrier protein ThiS [Chloroflexota bacterium]
MITVTVNGKRQRLDGVGTVAEYVGTLPVNRRHVAVARNGEVVPRERWAETAVEDGDVLEVVRMVGGGSTPSP